MAEQWQLIKNLDQLSNLLQGGESESLEFKEGFNDEAVESLCAFANHSGGDVLIGVTDAGEVKGNNLGKGTLEGWANTIKQSTDPKLTPSIATIKGLTLSNNKEVAVISIEKCLNATVSFKGKFFKRVGKTNQTMSESEIAQRAMARSQMSWDAGIETRAQIHDLDEKKFARFLVLLDEHKRRPVEPSSMANILEKLGLIDDSGITRAAALLLGKNPQQFYPPAFIKMGRFKSSTQIIDEIEIHGGLIEQIESTMDWLRLRLATEFQIKNSSARNTSWEYPLAAIREAIANAICHRDYNEDGPTMIKLYPSHIEFWNPGSLLAPLQIDDLKKEHRSIQRNRKVAETFFNCGFVERWGTGTLRMAELLKEQGYPSPEFQSSEQNVFKVTFRKEFTQEFLRQSGLNERQMKALKFLIDTGESINNPDYQDKYKVSKRTATRELAELVDKGFMEKHGSTGKGTRYSLR